MDAATLLEDLARYGPVGLLILSFLNNLIPFLPAFYLTAVSTYAALVEDKFAAYTGLIFAGLGAGLGKVALFALSSYIAARTARGRRAREYAAGIMARSRKARLSLAVAVFLVASLPLPDDIVYIPLGAAGFSLPLFALSVTAGKIFLVAFAYIMGRVYKNVVDLLVGDAIVYTLNGGIEALAIIVLGSTAFSIAVTLVLLSLDWEAIYKAYLEEGPHKALRLLAKEAVELVTLRKLNKNKTRIRGQ